MPCEPAKTRATAGINLAVFANRRHSMVQKRKIRISRMMQNVNDDRIIFFLDKRLIILLKPMPPFVLGVSNLGHRNCFERRRT
jgi:hypothetical protein